MNNEQNDSTYQDRVADILAMAKMHQTSGMGVDLRKAAEPYLIDGNSEGFRQLVLKAIDAAQPKPYEVSNSNKGLFAMNNEIKATPILDAVFSQLPEHAKADRTERARFNHDALKKSSPGRDVRGMLIDLGSLSKDVSGLQERGLATNVGTSGGYAVAEELLTGSFVDMLRNEAVALKMGAKTLTGLVGDIAIPSQTGGAVAYWVDEGEDLTESQPAFGQIRMTPHTVGCYTDISRRMLLQSSLDIESFIRQDFARQLAIAIDQACLSGANANGEPGGLLNAGIGSVADGAVSLAAVVELITDLSVGNALRGELGFAMDPLTTGKLVQAPVISSTDSRMLLDMFPAGGEFGNMLGHKVMVSNQLTNRIIFGDWSQLVLGMWSGLDVVVDRNTLAKSGGVRIVAFMDVDVAVRHAAAFSTLSVTS